LPGDAATPVPGHRPARGPTGARTRRAGQRTRPRGERLVAAAPARPRRTGPHRAASQPPAGRGPATGRPGRHREAGGDPLLRFGRLPPAKAAITDTRAVRGQPGTRGGIATSRSLPGGSNTGRQNRGAGSGHATGRRHCRQQRHRRLRHAGAAGRPGTVVLPAHQSAVCRRPAPTRRMGRSAAAPADPVPTPGPAAVGRPTLMGNLIRAEFRKVITTHLWWALLIPTLTIGLLFALVTGALGDALGAAIARAPDLSDRFSTGEWEWSVFGFARSINISTLMPLVFGGVALSGEYSQRTITLTFLTAPNRALALAAKAITYAVWGVVYGVGTVTGVSIGLAISVDSNRLPDASGWLAMAGVGVLSGV